MFYTDWLVKIEDNWCDGDDFIVCDNFIYKNFYVKDTDKIRLCFYTNKPTEYDYVEVFVTYDYKNCEWYWGYSKCRINNSTYNELQCLFDKYLIFNSDFSRLYVVVEVR